MEKEKGSRKRTRRAPQLPHWVPMSHHVPSGPMALLAVTGGTTQDISHPASLTLHSAPPAVSPTSPHIPPHPMGSVCSPWSTAPSSQAQPVPQFPPVTHCNPSAPAPHAATHRAPHCAAPHSGVLRGGGKGGGGGQLKPHCRILAERSTPGPPQSRCSAGRKCENHSVGAEERTERGRGGVG